MKEVTVHYNHNGTVKTVKIKAVPKPVIENCLVYFRNEVHEVVAGFHVHHYIRHIVK